MADPAEITQILRDATGGDRGAVDQLLPIVYDELRRLAESRLRDERSDHTLQATALVHEAYLRLVDQSRVEWQNRAHFFAVAAQAMRRILIDHARRHSSAKRGSGQPKLALDDVLGVAADRPDTNLLALDAALSRLREQHAVVASVVEMRFFAGLSNAEVGAVIGVSERTVRRHWEYARAWLYRELSADASSP